MGDQASRRPGGGTQPASASPGIGRIGDRLRIPPDVMFPPLTGETGVTVIRPDDLLVLTFERINLKLRTIGGKPHLDKSGPGARYLVVEFPPQHIVEQAYFEPSKEGLPVEVPGITPKEQLLVKGGVADWENRRKDLDAADPSTGQSESGEEVPDPPPIPARLSRLSRLVFRVQDKDLPLEFSLGSLLRAMSRLELSVPPNALPPKERTLKRSPHSFLVPPILAERKASRSALEVVAVLRARRKIRMVDATIGTSLVTGNATRDLLTGQERWHEQIDRKRLQIKPEPQEPSDHHTAIELPYRLILSPPGGTGWAHRTSTDVNELVSAETDRVELWHTRLGVPRKTEQGTEIGEDDHPLRIVRAVWARDGRPKPDPKTNPLAIPEHTADPFRASLDGFDRWNVTHLSSNFALEEAAGGPYEPVPVEVDRLMLSALGGWLDSRGAWDFPQPKGLSVEEWRHRATLARDHYVRVVYSGFLCPTGHRASVIKVTERRVHEEKPGDPAYLRQQMFLVCREPIRYYRNTGWKSDSTYLDLMWPFESMRITNLVSAPLDDPDHSDIKDKAQGCFWPQVGKQRYVFNIVATDAAGRRVDLPMPLIFIGKEHTDADWVGGEVVDKAFEAYEGQVIPLGGQAVALAEPSSPDDTSFGVESITVGVGHPGEKDYNKLPFYAPRFVPVMREASINAPAMQRIARTKDPARVVYPDAYLKSKDGFAKSGNAGQVFLAAAPGKTALSVPFSRQGDRSGALIAPDLSLGGVSRITGPVSGSDLTAAIGGKFEPTAWFGALDDAKLLGAFKLADVIEDAAFGDVAKVPRLVAQNLNVVEQLISDLSELAHDAPNPAAIKAKAGQYAASLEAGTLPSSLPPEIEALRATPPGGAGQASVVLQRLSAIDAAIAFLADNSAVLQAFAAADELPQRQRARLEWRPALKTDPKKVLQPGRLILTVEAADALDGAGEGRFTVTASLEEFDLVLPVLTLKFKHVLFRIEDGRKPDVDVVFQDDGILFTGVLDFVNTLRTLIPFSGFSDPPSVDVTPQGIQAGYSMGLPDLAVGVFSLQNLSLGAGFAVPFVGPPVSAWFQFCERENPALLTVTLFGGGAFVGVTVNPDGLYILEAALEFGAAIAVNFGVAAGGVSAMGGVYFKLEGSLAQLTGYFRLRGEVEALGIVSVCIELYMDLTYEPDPSNKCVGSASISIEIEVAMFSETISISTSKKFAGAGSDPTFRDMIDIAADGSSKDWNQYCAAFA